MESIMTTPREIMMVGALVDDVLHGDFSFSKSSEAIFGTSSRALPPIDEDIQNKDSLEANEDGLVVEVCSTFATESEAGFSHLPPSKSSLLRGSTTGTMPSEAITTGTTNTTERSLSTAQSDAEPSGFLGKFFQAKKPRQPVETNQDEFEIEEIAIAEDSREEDDFEHSTMGDSSDDDQSEFTESSSQSYLYEASTVGESRAPFLGSMSSVSMVESLAEQSAMSRASSVSYAESRDQCADTHASSFSYAETRDDCETTMSSMSSHTMEEEEEDREEEEEEEEYYEEDDTVADQEFIAEEPQTVTMKVSELMASAGKTDQKEKAGTTRNRLKLRPRKWLSWHIMSRREKRKSSFGPGKLEVIRESDEEVSVMMENMNIDGDDSRSTKRKTQEKSEDGDPNKKHKSMQATQAFSKLGPEWEITSFKQKSQKRFIPWNRRSSSKDQTFVITVRAEPSKEMTV